MTKVALRGFTWKSSESSKTFRSKQGPPLMHSKVLVFDTETTIDQYQNLKIGYFQIYQRGCLHHDGLFYNPAMLSERECKQV